MLRNSDRLLWVLLRRCWSDWRRVLVIIQPRTVVGWHRLGFRLFWRWKSRACGGRPSLDRQLITLIRRMWSSNPTWGSKRIQAELAKLGIAVSDSTKAHRGEPCHAGDRQAAARRCHGDQTHGT
jgi:putative transposase